MDTKVKGIVVKLTNYKDADKIASIFTYEQGKISAKFGGVRKEKAKLKAVSQPFVFADFNLSTMNNLCIVTGANVIDGFGALFNDYNKTICGYVVLDIIQSILPKDKVEEDVFLLTLSALKNIENQNPFVALIEYILNFIYFEGESVELENKNAKVYLDKYVGNFTFERNDNCMEIDSKVYNLIYSISRLNKDMSYEDISLPSEIVAKQAIRLLNNIILLKFNTELKSISLL